jgi:fused signal recognition particle receptor
MVIYRDSIPFVVSVVFRAYHYHIESRVAADKYLGVEELNKEISVSQPIQVKIEATEFVIPYTIVMVVGVGRYYHTRADFNLKKAGYKVVLGAGAAPLQ